MLVGTYALAGLAALIEFGVRQQPLDLAIGLALACVAAPELLPFGER